MRAYWESLGLPDLTWTWLLVGFVTFIVMSIGGLVLVSAILIRLPVDYFSDSPQRGYWADSHPALRWTGLIVKNLAGVALVILGIILSLPGVPGPGFLTILIGVMLTDFPGKRRLECWLIRRPTLNVAVNDLRRKYGKPPFALD